MRHHWCSNLTDAVLCGAALERGFSGLKTRTLTLKQVTWSHTSTESPCRAYVAPRMRKNRCWAGSQSCQQECVTTGAQILLTRFFGAREMLRRSQNKDIHSEASAMVPHEHPVAAMYGVIPKATRGGFEFQIYREERPAVRACN